METFKFRPVSSARLVERVKEIVRQSCPGRLEHFMFLGWNSKILRHPFHMVQVVQSAEGRLREESNYVRVESEGRRVRRPIWDWLMRATADKTVGLGLVQ